MKKTVLALAVFGAYAGCASAQSSVTLYGTVDLNARYTKADGQQRRLSESSGGLNSGQLGFRGSEDLGGGLQARFNLLADVFGDTGTNNATKFFNRTATVSLLGKFGEIRLGRDYTPTFLQLVSYDSAGYISLGAGLNTRQLYAGTRQDNAIQYLLPGNLAGVFGGAMVTSSEGGTTLDRPTRYIGGRLGYAAGPATIVAGAANQRFAVPFAVGGNVVSSTVAVVTALPGDVQRTRNISGSWDFGFMKVMATYDHESLKGYRENAGAINYIIPFGQHEIHGGYDRSKLKRANGVATTVDQIKATYVYHLSKRSAMYATVSRLDNKDATRLTLPGASGPTTAGGKSQGAEFGIRHFF